jgi:hypothetical protein
VEVVGLPKTFVTAYQTAWRHNPEHLNLNFRRRKKLKAISSRPGARSWDSTGFEDRFLPLFISKATIFTDEV